VGPIDKEWRAGWVGSGLIFKEERRSKSIDLTPSFRHDDVSNARSIPARVVAWIVRCVRPIRDRAYREENALCAGEMYP